MSEIESDTYPSNADDHPAPAVLAHDVEVTYRVRTQCPAGIRRFLHGDLRRRASREVRALRQVSFLVQAGEAVGLIGHNGSGKSTLLRSVAGLLPVTSGRIRVRSTPVLLGVRAALEPELSARANVLLGGTALKIPRRVLRERLDDIIAFAGIEEFADLPIRTLSTGMRARLQFAIATSAQPEILLIDESLSVGDAEFKERADARIRQILAASSTLIFVSHSMNAIHDICDRVLWLDHGQLIADGPTLPVIRAYQTHVRRLKGR